MVSTVHAQAYPQASNSFGRSDHSANMNSSFSQPHYPSFDASQSIASTPTATPPPPRPSSQQQMLYGMAGGPVMNGMPPRNSFGGYADVNGYGQHSYFANGMKPQIYTAVYSNVQVYEMEVNGIAVMRRRSDSWLNATQILKVAGVEKGKRTKVLEKEILNGEHEKVQGGYGRYQGTWINYERGVEFCRQYGVEEILRPLLEYDLRHDGMVNVPGGMETPTKEQAMAAQRKRMYNPMDNRPMAQATNGTFFKNMSSTAANAVNALNRTRYDSPGRGLDGRRSMGPRRSSQGLQASQESMYPGGSQQSMQSLASQDSFTGTAPNGASFSFSASFAEFPNTDAHAPPRKRQRLSPQNSFSNNIDPGLELSIRESSSTEPNESFFSQNDQSFMAPKEGIYGLPSLPAPRSPDEIQKKEMLIDLFIDPLQSDFADHPAFLTMSGEDFEIPIDDSGNTALHWAATLARIPLVRQLLAKGFNISRANSGGQTALISACLARNNHDHNSFSDLLELLGPSIELRDARGRTLVHHIAISSAMKGRAGVGRYYLESLLEFVVRRGSASSSQEAGHDESTVPFQKQNGTINLGRFMSDIVNARDKYGDTALNLAARTSTRSIIDQLLEVGADPHAANNGGLAPVDFGVNGTHERPPAQPIASMDNAGTGATSTQTSVAEAQSDVMMSMKEVLTASELDFAAELREKQEILDIAHRALKESSTTLVEERRRLGELQARAHEKSDLKQKIENLNRLASDLRNELTQSKTNGNSGSDGIIMENVQVGEADKGLDFDGRLSDVSNLFPGDIDPNMTLNAEQIGFLQDSERADILMGRIKAYHQHNANLEGEAQDWRARSKDLEQRYKTIVSLCTNVPDEQLDGILDGLMTAVEAEQQDGEQNTGRVRDFMRMIRERF